MPNSFTKNFLEKKEKKKLIDIGCGNARDTFFFYKKKIEVTAIDRSNKAIKSNIRYANKFNFKNINFKRLDINRKTILKNNQYDYIYLRFFVHTIPQSSQKKLFELIKRISKKKKSLVMIEFRTDKDPLKEKGKILSNNETINTHYRRFIESDKFINLFQNYVKCELIYKREGRGLSIVGKDNPHLCRLVFKRK